MQVFQRVFRGFLYIPADYSTRIPGDISRVFCGWRLLRGILRIPRFPRQYSSRFCGRFPAFCFSAVVLLHFLLHFSHFSLFCSSISLSSTADFLLLASLPHYFSISYCIFPTFGFPAVVSSISYCGFSVFHFPAASLHRLPIAHLALSHILPCPRQ